MAEAAGEPSYGSSAEWSESAKNAAVAPLTIRCVGFMQVSFRLDGLMFSVFSGDQRVRITPETASCVPTTQVAKTDRFTGFWAAVFLRRKTGSCVLQNPAGTSLHVAKSSQLAIASGTVDLNAPTGKKNVMDVQPLDGISSACSKERRQRESSRCVAGIWRGGID